MTGFGPMKHAWLKLLTSILWSRKFRSLPDNDHRMCYIGHLILQKIGLQNEDFGFISSTLFVSLRRYKTIRKKLIEVALLDESGNVMGFDDSQLTPEAARKRRQRERDKSRDKSREKSRTGHPDSREQRADSREEEGNARTRASFPPSDAQMRMLEKMASERGTALAEVCRRLEIEEISRDDVSAIKGHLAGRNLADMEAEEREARNARLADLKDELERIYHDRGPDQAREFIHDHDDVQSGLWVKLTELESGFVHEEETT